MLLIVTSACHHHDHDTPDAAARGIGPWPLPATVHAASDDPALLADWNTELGWTVPDFDFGLSAVPCPPPFKLVAPGDPADHEIRLVASSTDLEVGMIGGEVDGDDGAIVIVGRPHPANPIQSPLRGTISHELGHAAGLGHADPSFGLSAMTRPPDVQLRARDVAALGCRLACGPCDPTSDPYTSP